MRRPRSPRQPLRRLPLLESLEERCVLSLTPALPGLRQAAGLLLQAATPLVEQVEATASDLARPVASVLHTREVARDLGHARGNGGSAHDTPAVAATLQVPGVLPGVGNAALNIAASTTPSLGVVIQAQSEGLSPFVGTEASVALGSDAKPGALPLPIGGAVETEVDTAPVGTGVDLGVNEGTTTPGGGSLIDVNVGGQLPGQPLPAPVPTLPPVDVSVGGEVPPQPGEGPAVIVTPPLLGGNPLVINPTVPTEPGTVELSGPGVTPPASVDPGSSSPLTAPPGVQEGISVPPAAGPTLEQDTSTAVAEPAPAPAALVAAANEPALIIPVALLGNDEAPATASAVFQGGSTAALTAALTSATPLPVQLLVRSSTPGALAEATVVPSEGVAAEVEPGMVAEVLATPTSGTDAADLSLAPAGEAAGVVEEFVPFAPGVLEQAMQQFLGEVQDLGEELTGMVSVRGISAWLFAAAAAAVAYEMARRRLGGRTRLALAGSAAPSSSHWFPGLRHPPTPEEE